MAAAGAVHAADVLAREQSRRREQLEEQQHREAAAARNLARAASSAAATVTPANAPQPAIRRKSSTRALSAAIPAAPTESASRLVMHPTSAWRQAWDLLIVALIAYSVADSPYRAAFHDGSQSDLWLALATVGDCLFLADVFVNLHTAFVAPGGEYVSDVNRIRRRYARSWLLIDALSALPLELLGAAAGLGPEDDAYMVLLAVRMLRVLRLPRSMWLLDSFAGLYAPNGWRVFKASMMFVATSHFAACAWFGVVRLEDSADCTASSCAWTINNGVDLLPERSKYIASLYWSVTTLTSVGYGDLTPSTDAEKLLAIVVQLAGGILYALVVGQIAVALSNVGAAAARWQEVTEQAREFMRYHALPPELCGEVRLFLDHQWALSRGLNSHGLVSTLPDGLRDRVLMHLFAELVQRVEFLRNRPERFILSVVRQLQPVTFMPGDYVMRAGDLGDAMFFLKRGNVDVILRNGTVIAQLGPGAFVGEIALLLEMPRTASVRASAASFVDAYRLTHGDFDSVLGEFPRERESLQEIAQRRHTEVLSAGTPGRNEGGGAVGE